jgi:hypothetical protein
MKKIFIGIDFSKEKFDATLIQAEGLKECAPDVHEVFDNKTSGYRRLVKWVKAHAEGFTADMWLFCGENTAVAIVLPCAIISMPLVTICGWNAPTTSSILWVSSV